MPQVTRQEVSTVTVTGYNITGLTRLQYDYLVAVVGETDYEKVAAMLKRDGRYTGDPEKDYHELVGELYNALHNNQVK
jgi:hypothetical protein